MNLDYIFLIGPSAVGKTTLAKGLFARFGGVYIEQNMVPEFSIPEDCPDAGMYEESLCWDNVMLQTRFFHERGCRPVIALDVDDVRARELPLMYRGKRFLILRLVCSEDGQILRQMERRRQHEGGLYAPEWALRANEVIRRRALLPNEQVLDVAGKSPEQVLEEAAALIETFVPETDFAYTPDDEKHYLSWVQSRGLK